MKNVIMVSLMFIVFILTLTGLPLYMLQMDTVTSAHAMGFNPWRHHHHNPPPPPPPPQIDPTDGGHPTQSVPEPVTLVLLGVGIAGVGAYSVIRKKIK